MGKEKPSLESKVSPENVKKTALKGEKHEFGGFEDENLPEPTRYGDWEVKGRCSDF